MSEIQSVIFMKKFYDTKKARRFLKRNKLKAIKKVHITENYYRYRIRNPKRYKTFRTKPLKKKRVKVIIGFK